MVQGFPDERRDAHGEEGHWRALEELGSIVRAVLLAAVALAIGWLASTWIEVPPMPDTARMQVTAR